MIFIIFYEVLLQQIIQEWQSDGKTELILIKSTDSKAFSAGGDIKSTQEFFISNK